MKLFRLLLTFVILNSTFQITGAQSWQWARVPQFIGNPYVQSDGEGFSVAADGAGNVYEAGFLAYTTMIYGKDTLSGIPQNFYLTKYNNNGVPQWALQTTTSNGGAFPYAISTDRWGDVYATGIFEGDVHFGATIIHSDSTASMFLVKYDTNGNLLWARQSSLNAYIGNGAQGDGLAIDASGNAYVTGQFSDSIIFGTHPLKTQGNLNSDMFLVKYDSSGNAIWATSSTIPSSIDQAFGDAVAIDPSGNVYVTGTFFDTVSFGATTLITRSWGGEVFLVKYDAQGNVLWAKQSHNIDGSGSIATVSGPNITNGITTDRLGNVYISGSYQSDIHFDSVELMNTYPYFGFSRTLFIVRYDSTGKVVWGITGEPQDNASWAGVGLASDTFNHIFFNGMAYDYPDGPIYSSIQFGAKTFANTDTPSNETSLVLELDTAGNILCGAVAPMGGDDYEGIAADPTGKYVYIGGDYSVQYSSVILGPDTLYFPGYPINGGGSYEVPFILRWNPCAITTPPLAAIVSKTDVTCHGSCDGTATGSGSGGTPPYRYLWNTQPTDTAHALTGLCAGGYTLTVTDSTGATASASVTIAGSAVAIGAITSSGSGLCTGSTDTLSVTGILSNMQWQSTPTGSDFTNIPGANDSVYVSPVTQTTVYRVIAGSGACADTSSPYTLNVYPVPVPMVTTVDTIFCTGDSTRVCATHTFASYQWNTSDTTQCTTAKAAGGYWITVTDANHCSAVSGHQQINIYPVPSVSIIQQGDTLSSFGQSNYQWILNGTPVNGATGSVYVAHQAGSYQVQVTDTNGCTTISEPLLVTGIQDIAGEESVLVYPNPSVSNWQLAVSNELVGSALQVYDEQGRIVFTSAIRNLQSQINLDVSSGVYYLRIANDKVSVVRKLVKI